MNDTFTTFLLGISNRRDSDFNGKTLLVDGIEYIVYRDSCYFTLSPVNEELYVRARCLIVPFETERAEQWREVHKSIRVLTNDQNRTQL
jgi:hypothetical protein